MFLSHLNCFIGGIAVLLFFLRYKSHSFSENILFIFTGISFVSSSLWLYVNYYDHDINSFVDFFGIFIENFLLSTCVFYIYSLGKKHKKFEQITYFILLSFSLLLYFIHYKFASGNSFIFHPSNKNVINNIYFQIVIDCILFITFLYLFFTKKMNDDSELFDGNFKKYILLAFSFYFIQDIFILSFFIVTIKGLVLPQVLMNVTLFLNTLTTLFLVMVAIYTNWLKEYNKLRNIDLIEEDQNNTIIPYSLSIEDLKLLKKIDWNEIYHHFKSTHSELLIKIETTDKLSQTEKLYYFLDFFNFSNKEISDLLFVSIRTVETNFYRLRKKIKKK